MPDNNSDDLSTLSIEDFRQANAKDQQLADTQGSGQDTQSAGQDTQQSQDAQQAQDTQKSGQDTQPGAVTVDPWDIPPKSWDAETKSKFADIKDPVLRKQIHKREEDFFKGIQGYQDKARQWDDLDRIIQPYMPLLRANGNTAHGAVQNLMNMAYQLHTDPVNTLRGLLRMYNVDPAHLASSAGAGGGSGAVGPSAEVLSLQREVAGLKNTLFRASETQSASARAYYAGEVERFASDPKNKYYENVKDDMVRVIQAGMAKDLPEAYEKAVKLNPSVSAAIEQDRLRAVEAQRIEQARQKADAAKKAGFNVQGSDAGSGKRSQNESLVDTLSRNWDRAAAH